MRKKPNTTAKSKHSGPKKSLFRRIMKIVLWVSLLPAILLLVFLSWTYVNYAKDKNPEKTFLKPYMSAIQAEVFSLNQEESEMTLKLLIINHMPIPINGDDFHCKLFLDDHQIINNKSNDSFKLKGGDSTWVTIPMHIMSHDYRTLLHAKELKKIDSVQYVLQISFGTNMLFRKQYNLEYKKILPLFHFPDINAHNLKIEALNLKRAKFGMVVTLKNNNSFPLRTKNVNYKFSIEGHNWMKGTIEGLTIIEPKASKQFYFPVTVNFKEDGMALFRLLKYRKNLNYKLDLDFTLASKNSILSDSKIIYHTNGTVESLRKDEDKNSRKESKKAERKSRKNKRKEKEK